MNLNLVPTYFIKIFFFSFPATGQESYHRSPVNFVQSWIKNVQLLILSNVSIFHQLSSFVVCILRCILLGLHYSQSFIKI